MSAFDNLFGGGSAWALLRLHGERVTYLPKTGRTREITVIPVREPLSELAPIADGVAPVLRIKALTNPDDEDWGGIAPEKLVIGGDKIRIARRPGEEPKDRTILRVLGVKAGMVHLELR